MKIVNKTLYIYTETPLHVGTGTGLGAVDMPIQREKHTAYPLIQASGLKGALRHQFETHFGKDSLEMRQIFSDENQEHAGAISPSDARMLCFPVRALNGVFVWVTSPVVLERYSRETHISDAPTIPDSEKALVSHSNMLLGSDIMLEEFTYEAVADETAAVWAGYIAENVFPQGGYWHNRMRSHFVILPDNEFRDFVRYSTEIVTRIKINSDTKTVDKEKGALFTQELLPADSLLYAVVRMNPRTKENTYSADDILDKLSQSIDENGALLQIGGDETVGRGRVHLTWGAS